MSLSKPGSSMPKSSKNISLSSSSNVAISSSIFALITITSESSFAAYSRIAFTLSLSLSPISSSPTLAMYNIFLDVNN
ncbi:Uncharacterised protein [Streptococcus pneumoniae]|nr:Uncharacterised protein [Streptococcus pneumoniae]